jgi:uncharacterized protein (DUF488 family)
MPKRNRQKPIYTIGHSTRSFEELVQILQSRDVTLLADVRAIPRSRFYPHFNRPYLEEHLPMRYSWMGDRLGGKNANQIPPHIYQQGIDDLVELSKHETVCIMCSEGTPTPTKWTPAGCHRWHTISPLLEAKGVEVLHL